VKRRVVCEECKSTLEYDDRSVCLGNRDREDIKCPICKNIVDTVFTDLIPNVRVIQKGETK
jgi:hypothetical protein